jgi:hypothetical protein
MGLGHSHFVISVVLPGGGTLRRRNEQVRRPRHDPTLPEVHLTLRLRSGAAKAHQKATLH